MGVRDLVPEAGRLSTDVTYGSHDRHRVPNAETQSDLRRSLQSMADVVTPPRQGLEVFASERRRTPLKIAGAKAAILERLGITSIQDLLQHYPRRHVDRTQLRTISDLSELAQRGNLGEVTIHARVRKMGTPFAIRTKKPGAKPRKMIKAQIEDETGTLEVTWFNQDWVPRALQQGSYAFFYGRLGFYGKKLQMTAPRFEVVKSGKEPFNVGRIIPIYPATADLSSDQLRRLMWDTLQRCGPIADPLPEDLQHDLMLLDRGDAIRLIHFPDSKKDVLAARSRIVFDEVFTLQLGLVYRKRKLERLVKGIAHASVKAESLAESFVAELPFKLTAAQRTACDEVAGDMAKSHPMHRLLEGEVGSGKTVVAVYACLIAIEGHFQAAIMAPTEVLAEQHHLTVAELLDRAFGGAERANLFAEISRRPVVRLLTGSTSAAQKAAILEEVASGAVDLLIGTHALIQDSVEFARLGLAVVDEQHRFGVHQRKRLREKGTDGEPDVLVMTATPIPRTLAVTIYGDLDLSILDELPKGRIPIQTRVAAGDKERQRAYDLIRSEVAAGRQAFVVYALREESEKTDLRNAKAEAKRLADDVFPDLRVGLVHGDMKSDAKEAAMTAFRSGETDVLVATTVIEVGVDVPNATVMMIEDAERFGLAQLHQLRGRVGRAKFESYCILVTELDLGRADDDPGIALAAERLSAVESKNDGFELAIVDLRQRGEGELFGARQSGMPALRLARVLEHEPLIKQARDLAVKMLGDDPELEEYHHQDLAREMRDRFPPDALEVVHSG
jgi:ATP-dependent DNA helicase RecG